MKVYHFILVLTVCFTHKFFGQELPEVIGRSPEAAEFLKYGNYPVNLSTGVPNISIPLYTVQSGDYQLPITLNYHASGIKVNQEASWVGLGWNLSAGAQIVLEVRDGPDEYNDSFDSQPNYEDVYTYMENNPNGYGDSFFTPLKNNSWIKDVYNFSSPTVSGKFIIEDFANKEITVFPPEAFQVELTGARDTKSFTITDKMGNQYVFNNTREYSQTLQQYQPPLYTSAWYVDEIITPKDNVIGFSYHDAGGIWQFSYGQTVTKTAVEDPLYACKGIDAYSETLSSIQNSNSTLFTETKKIKDITFNSGRVTFEVDRTRLDVLQQSDLSTNPKPCKLNTIKVEAKHPATGEYSHVKDIGFNYSYFTSSETTSEDYKKYRLRLDKIGDLIGNEETKFSYSDIELPLKDSFSQDYWGYYNGASNSDLIPEQYVYISPTGLTPYLTQVGSADRNVNSNTIQAGILKEIEYPTKGKTVFDFEPNTYFGEEVFEEYTVTSKTLFGVGDGYILEALTTPGPNGDICTGLNARNKPSECRATDQFTFNPSATKNTYLRYNITDSNPNGDDPEYKYAYKKISVSGAGGEIFSTTGVTSQEVTINLGVISGPHTVSLEAYGSYLKLEVEVEYLSEDVETNLYAQGLRVKSITNSDYDDNQISKKVYEYHDVSDSSKSSGILSFDGYADFRSRNMVNYSSTNCTSSNQSSSTGWLKTTSVAYNSNSYNGLERSSVTYKNVTEKNIELNNISNGYTVYTFKTDEDFWYDNYGYIKIGLNYKRGNLLLKEVYNNDNLIVKKEENNYVDDTRKTVDVKGFKLFQHVTISNGISPELGMPETLSSIFEIADYDISVDWFYQDTSKITDYFYDSSNTLIDSLITTTDYIYENPDHLQLTKTKTEHSSGEYIITDLFYPDDINSTTALGLDGLTTEQFNAIKRLKNPSFELNGLHHVGEVIQTNVYRDKNGDGVVSSNELLSVQRKNYKDWGNDIVLPKDIQTLKGVYNASTNTLQERVTYQDYYTNGNIREVSKANGTSIYYIWGYNEQYPVAKIENFTSVEAGAIQTSLIDPVISASDADNSPTTENTLRTVLNNLRNDTALSNAMITTYTYDPLIGVTSVTDPKGYITYYEYDELNRLQFIKDDQDNLLSENQYNYKN